MNWGSTTWTVNLKCREVKTEFYQNRFMQTSSSETLIGCKTFSFIWVCPSLAAKLEKPLLSLYGTEWNELGYGLSIVDLYRAPILRQNYPWQNGAPLRIWTQQKTFAMPESIATLPPFGPIEEQSFFSSRFPAYESLRITGLHCPAKSSFYLPRSPQPIKKFSGQGGFFNYFWKEIRHVTEWFREIKNADQWE
jgi:hypothetical protein